MCSDGQGKYFGGQFVIDVYHIDDVIAFQDPSTATCGKEYRSEPDLQSSWRLIHNVLSIEQSPHTYTTNNCVCDLFVVLCVLL